MRGNKRRVIILYVLFSIFCTMVPYKPPANAVTAAYDTNKDLLRIRTNDISSTTNGEIVINEVMFCPDEGEYEWVELKNIGTDSIDVNGWLITDEDDNWYKIPDGLPKVPANAFVVIIFDGKGEGYNDFDFGDNTAILHSQVGLVDIYEDEIDQVSLYQQVKKFFLPIVYSGSSNSTSKYRFPLIPSSVIDKGIIRAFIAWGGDSEDDDFSNAVDAGIWFSDWTIYPFETTGARVESNAIECGRTIGLLPVQTDITFYNITLFLSAESSIGSENPIPSITQSNIEEAEWIPSDSFAMGWTSFHNATYHLQIDDNKDFSSPIIDEIVINNYYSHGTIFPEGTYFWRVQTIIDGETSSYSNPIHINVYYGDILNYNNSNFSVFENSVISSVSITWLRQKKDTNLVCLDGDPEGAPDILIEESWDDPHPDDQVKPHGYNNCVRASIAMIVRNYGGFLSQDRLSYELFENQGNPIDNIGMVGRPELDLGHKQTTWVCGSDGSHGRVLLAWALGVDESEIEYHEGKPLFYEITRLIENGQPLMMYWDGHVTVIGGYRIKEDGTQEVLVYDSYYASKEEYKNYSSLNFGCYYIAPPSAPNVRSDEVEIWMDSDNDGIYDFDEIYRFGTDPLEPDSDNDGVLDLQDIREYMFDNYGIYRYQPNGNGLYSPDYDHDTLRKELDWDNDNGGSADGCEDFNFNGIYEPELLETYNFDKSSERYCHERICEFVTDVQRIECEALLALFDSSNGIDWTNNANWLDSTTVGDWYGVKVDNNHVTELTLKDNHLIGSLPAELGNLFNLKHLNLSYNDLSGNIPKELGDLYSLQHLYLDYNDLSGNIPPELGNLSNLISLDLTGNPLAGSIPPQLGNLKNLDSMVLGYNDLTGSIPGELGDLNNLKYLNLGGNNLSGSIPSDLGNLSKLQFLVLSDNDFIGGLPSELGDLFYLVTLAVDYNPLSGPIPLSFINLTYLYNFYFYETYLCEPQTAEFLAWKAIVDGWWWSNGMICP